MKKTGRTGRAIRTIVVCLSIGLLYCVLHVLLVLVFPQVLFSDRVTRGNLTIHMREEIPPEIDSVLDRVQSLLAASDLYDDEDHHEVFILNSYPLSRYLLVRNVHFGCNMPSGDSFVVDADVKNDLAFCRTFGPDDRRLRTLSETIVHEITHALIREHLGWNGDRQAPSWIKEGYCEYIAQGSAIDHEEGLMILRGGGWSVPGFPNFKHRLMVEYLINGRNLTIDEILHSPPDYRQVEAAVLEGVRTDEKAFLAGIGSTIGQDDPAEEWR